MLPSTIKLSRNMYTARYMVRNDVNSFNRTLTAHFLPYDECGNVRRGRSIRRLLLRNFLRNVLETRPSERSVIIDDMLATWETKPLLSGRYPPPINRAWCVCTLLFESQQMPPPNDCVVTTRKQKILQCYLSIYVGQWYQK